MVENITLIILAFILIWLGVLSFYLYKSLAHYGKLTRLTGKEQLGDILDGIVDKLKGNSNELELLRKELEKVINENKYHIQRVGILRFNPFSDVGGEQSFVLAVLDSCDTGIVLTSLHNRGATRWYVKSVKEGKGLDFQLSEEEKKVIAIAGNLSKERKEKTTIRQNGQTGSQTGYLRSGRVTIRKIGSD
ncbi:DUF4446 family protein [Patescibacteria group bacterium]|nr:DUF4446 family protein [Patescibacteria group bacterium]MCL5798175.1 DUF4446 family protein [Patescibacteria group bacterium]